MGKSERLEKSWSEDACILPFTMLPPKLISMLNHFCKQDRLIYLLIWLCQVLVVTHRIFSCHVQTLSCSKWDLVLWPGIISRPPALGAQSLHHWTIKEVPRQYLIFCNVLLIFYSVLWKTQFGELQGQLEIFKREFLHVKIFSSSSILSINKVRI